MLCLHCKSYQSATKPGQAGNYCQAGIECDQWPCKSAKMCVAERKKCLFRGICSSVLGWAAAVRARVHPLIAAPILQTQLLFVLLLPAGQNRDAAVHDWVGDLSLGAKWMTEMKAANTIHCLGPEMAALFHVELLPYPYNPFPAAHTPWISAGLPPLAVSQVPKNSCRGFICTWQRQIPWGDSGAMPQQHPPCAEVQTHPELGVFISGCG